MATVEEMTLTELQTLNAHFSEFETYLKEKDVAAAAAAVVQADAAAAALQEEKDFRLTLTDYITWEQSKPEQTAAGEIDYTNLLTEIREDVAPNVDSQTLDFYSDAAIVFLIVGVFPIYLTYRIIKSVFNMLARAI